MNDHMWRAGTTCLRGLVLASGLVILTGGTATFAQDKLERPKSDENSKFETLRGGNAAVVIEGDKAATEQNRQLLEKYARWYVLRLNDAQAQKDGLSAIVQDASKRMLFTPYSRLKPEQRQFVEEYGKKLIGLLTDLSLRSGKQLVRVNAARMASEVGRMGYDGTAELCLQILEKPDESDGVKLWALHALHNLFAIAPDTIVEAKTVFQKKDDGVLPPLERKSIQALINFIGRTVPMPADIEPAQVEAYRYVRREAIRALGQVRVQTVKNLGQAESRPAFALLKAARRDIPAPVPNVSEMFEAVIGFCHLLPDRDRDLQLDYAAHHIGIAVYEIVDYRVNNLTDQSIPWKATASRLRDALDAWRKRCEENKLQDAKLVKDLFDIAERDFLPQMEAGQQGILPNAQPLAAWLGEVKPQSKSLFKSDEKTVIQSK